MERWMVTWLICVPLSQLCLKHLPYPLARSLSRSVDVFIYRQNSEKTIKKRKEKKGIVGKDSAQPVNRLSNKSVRIISMEEVNNVL